MRLKRKRSHGTIECPAEAPTHRGGARLYYHGARYYIPWLARWTASDPINSENYNLAKGYGLGKNKSRHFLHLTASSYEYCKDNPVKNTDPNGEQEVPVDGEDSTVHQLAGVTVYGEKKRSFWEKAGAFAKGFAKGLVITAAIVGLIVFTGGLGLVGAAVATTIAATATVAGGIYTYKTAKELYTGKDAATGRKLSSTEKWEMGGELAGGMVVGGGKKMFGGKKAPTVSETPTSRWTSNATEAPVFSEPTITGAGKFTEPTNTGVSKFAEPVKTSEVESAATTLLRMEAENPGSHFVSRHGAKTTLQEQYVRSTTGFTPDGVQGRTVNSTRFLSEMDQLEAANIATQHFQQTGESSFSFDMGRIIGEGYMKGGGNRVEASQVQAVFRNNKLYTMYPKP